MLHERELGLSVVVGLMQLLSYPSGLGDRDVGRLLSDDFKNEHSWYIMLNRCFTNSSKLDLKSALHEACLSSGFGLSSEMLSLPSVVQVWSEVVLGEVWLSGSGAVPNGWPASAGGIAGWSKTMPVLGSNARVLSGVILVIEERLWPLFARRMVFCFLGARSSGVTMNFAWAFRVFGLGDEPESGLQGLVVVKATRQPPAALSMAIGDAISAVFLEDWWSFCLRMQRTVSVEMFWPPWLPYALISIIRWRSRAEKTMWTSALG